MRPFQKSLSGVAFLFGSFLFEGGAEEVRKHDTIRRLASQSFFCRRREGGAQEPEENPESKRINSIFEHGITHKLCFFVIMRTRSGVNYKKFTKLSKICTIYAVRGKIKDKFAKKSRFSSC